MAPLISQDVWDEPWEAVEEACDVLVNPVATSQGLAFDVPVHTPKASAGWQLLGGMSKHEGCSIKARLMARGRPRRASREACSRPDRATHVREVNSQKRRAAECARLFQSQHRWRLSIQLSARTKQASSLRSQMLSDRTARAANHNERVADKVMRRREDAVSKWLQRELASFARLAVLTCKPCLQIEERASRAREHNHKHHVAVERTREKQAELKLRADAALSDRLAYASLAREASAAGRVDRARSHNQAVRVKVLRCQAKRYLEQRVAKAFCNHPSPRIWALERAEQARESNEIKALIAKRVCDEQAEERRSRFASLEARLQQAAVISDSMVAERADRAAWHNWTVTQKVAAQNEAFEKRRKEKMLAIMLKKSAGSARVQSSVIGPFAVAWTKQLVDRVINERP